MSAGIAQELKCDPIPNIGLAKFHGDPIVSPLITASNKRNYNEVQDKGFNLNYLLQNFIFIIGIWN